MNKIHPNNPAYIDGGIGGMTIRAEIAQRILTALYQNTNVIQATQLSGWSLVNCTPEQLAEMAVGQADALIAELNKATP